MTPPKLPTPVGSSPYDFASDVFSSGGGGGEVNPMPEPISATLIGAASELTTSVANFSPGVAGAKLTLISHVFPGARPVHWLFLNGK